MLFALLCGLAFIAGITAFAVPGIWRRMDWMWVGTFVFGLLALGSLAPDPLVGIVIGWIGVHPIFVYLARRQGLLPTMPAQQESYRYLWSVGAWAAVYLLSAHALTAGGLRLLAWLWWGWAAWNALTVLWQKCGGQMPRWFQVNPDLPLAGWVGGSWFCSYCIILGLFSTYFLGGWPWVAVPFFLVALVAVQHYTAPLAAAAALIVIFHGAWLLLPVAGVAALSFHKLNGRARSIHARLHMWWVVSGLIILTKGLGVGLGGLNNLAPQNEEEYRTIGVFANVHNDWLQALVELSPLPVLAGLLELGRRLVFLSPVPEHLFVTMLVVFTAVLAVPYFPLRHPSQALVLALAMGYR